jgi:hypothetical protein
MRDPTGGVLSSNPAVGGSAADENCLASQSVNTASDRTICFAFFSSCRRGDVSSPTLNNCDLVARTVHRVI